MIIKREKGWFKATGLHHGTVTALAILAGHLFGIGDEVAMVVVGAYFGNEFSEARHRGGWNSATSIVRNFEIMDFLMPLVMGLVYWVVI